MRASDFEFRYRSWFIILIFVLAFGCYAFERVNAVEWLLRVLGRSDRVAGIFPVSPEARAILAIGAAIVGLGALIRTWGTAYLKTEVVRDSAVHAERLVADGPYRYVRNPLYLGTLLLAVGLAPLATPVGCALLVVGMTIFLLRLIGREEAFLIDQQSDAYRAYLVRVPRLWPSLRPRVPAGGAAPRWGQAWMGEMAMWAIFAGSAYFAFTLDMKVFDIVVIGGVFLSRVIHPWIKHRVEQVKT
jgi:protein-S-isoprenylcysteine O-methyltransferase Ste14